MPEPEAESRPITAEGWHHYYVAVAGRLPHETLVSALARFEAEGIAPEMRVAVDLGCGDGRDTVEMLRHGWRVLAIDAQEEAIRRLCDRPDLPSGCGERLTTEVSRYEEALWPEGVTLVNASLSLPFCPPERFAAVWAHIFASLASGGRFCGHLFGERDDWAPFADRTHHTRAEAESLLAPYILEQLDEQEWDGTTARGTPKHWHSFQIVARKP